MAKNNKISLGNLKTQESKKFTTRKIIVDKYEVNIDEHFRNSKIKDLVLEFIDKYSYAKKNDIEFNTITYMSVLTLKYFTDIEFPDDLESQYRLMEILFDLGYLEQINNSFDEEELVILNKKIVEYTNNINETMKDIDEESVSELENIEQE